MPFLLFLFLPCLYLPCGSAFVASPGGGTRIFEAREVMRTAAADQRLKPQDEKRKQALIQIAFDLNAPGLRPHFHGSPVF